MFNIFNRFKANFGTDAKKFTRRERSYVIKILKVSNFPKQWYENVEFYWDGSLGKNTNGVYRVLKKNKVFISDYVSIHSAAPTVAHECIHNKQRIGYTAIVYKFMCVPGLNYLTIEKEARVWEDKVWEYIKEEANRAY